MNSETSLSGPGSSAVQNVASADDGQSEPSAGRSFAFIVFAVLLIGVAAVAGMLQSGKLNLNQYFNVPKAGATAIAAVVTHVASAAPVAPLKPNAFVVTSISLGQPSYAIINGQSRTEGDALTAPGVTGWKVRQIADGVVSVQNGSTVTALGISTPGIKPLNDELHPLN